MTRVAVRRLFFVVALGAAVLSSGATASAATAPSIQATWVEKVTATSADLHAEINPNGASTTHHFEYITEAAYQANLAAVPAREGFSGAVKTVETGTLPVFAHLGALSPVTVYRFRVVATNSVDTTIGPERFLGTEEATNAFRLLDNRGWEMVSPIDKNGGAIQGFGGNFGGGVLQAAADGNSATYSSADSFGAAPAGAPPASQYLARRGGGGWASDNITTPLLSGSYGDEPVGVPYQLFAGDLSRGLLLDPRHCEEGAPCSLSYSLRDNASGASIPSPRTADLRFAGASPDLGHVVLSTCAALTADATEVPGTEGCNPAETNLYEWSGGAPRLINLLPGEVKGTPGARLAAQVGAISPDAGRIYFTELEDGFLYLREADGSTQLLGEGGTAFQTASSDDGRFAFFTSGGDLLRHDAVTEATGAPLASGVLGVLGASADGSRVYYVTGAGLFLWNDGVTTKVAAAAAASDYLTNAGTARVSPDGSHLLFLSAAELTGYESNGVTEVFLYGPPPAGGAPKLTCVSCNPTGERPSGSSSTPGAVANGTGPTATRAYKPRSLSADGSRVFFDSSDVLAIQDTNSRPDVYEWEAPGAGSCSRETGCVGLISSGRSGAASTFVDASANGSDALFLTDSSLYPLDPGSFDVYDARVDGGFTAPQAPIPCIADACQALPSAPEDPTPGTLVPNSGNPPLHIVPVKSKRKHKHHRKHRHKNGSRR